MDELTVTLSALGGAIATGLGILAKNKIRVSVAFGDRRTSEPPPPNAIEKRLDEIHGMVHAVDERTRIMEARVAHIEGRLGHAPAE